jgi:hypothetical protein
VNNTYSTTIPNDAKCLYDILQNPNPLSQSALYFRKVQDCTTELSKTIVALNFVRKALNRLSLILNNIL